MSKIITFAVFCALASQGHAQTTAQQVAALLKQASAAEAAGDPVAAGEAYKSALKLDPKNPDARYSIGQLRANAPAIAARGREAKFGAVMIPSFQLDEATLKEALEAFSVLIEKESKEQVTPNFVVEDPKGLLAGKKLSLNLKNLPSKAVMKYIADQTGTKVRYDEHAVVLSPR